MPLKTSSGWAQSSGLMVRRHKAIPWKAINQWAQVWGPWLGAPCRSGVTQTWILNSQSGNAIRGKQVIGTCRETGACRVRALPKDAQRQCCCAGIVSNAGLSKRKPAASHGLQATFGPEDFHWWSLPEHFKKFSIYATFLRKRFCQVCSHEFGKWEQCTLLKNVLEMFPQISYSQGLQESKCGSICAHASSTHLTLETPKSPLGGWC